MSNINFGDYVEHVGDKFIIYQYLSQGNSSIFENGEESVSKLSEGKQRILMVELLIKYLDDLGQKIVEGVKIGRYPIRIEVTQLVDDGIHGVYYNGGNQDTDLWKVVDLVFSTICIMHGGGDFYAQHVRVGNGWYYELMPVKS